MDKKCNEENDEFTSKSIKNSLKECPENERNYNDDSKHMLKENIQTVSDVPVLKGKRKCRSFSEETSENLQNKKPSGSFHLSSLSKTSADEAHFGTNASNKGSSKDFEINCRYRSVFSGERKGKISTPGVISEQNKCGPNDSALVPADSDEKFEPSIKSVGRSSFNKGKKKSTLSLETSQLDSKKYSNSSNSLAKSELTPEKNESIKDMFEVSREMPDAHISTGVASDGITRRREMATNTKETRDSVEDTNSEAGPSGIRAGKERFACGLCDKEFTREWEFDIHYRTHTVEKHSVDNVCGRELNRKAPLNRHYRSNLDEKPFICDVCGKGFVRKYTLRLHYQTHTNENSFICDLCHKSFALKSSLDKHYQTHTDEKSFVCDICKKRFSSKSHLERHYLIHTAVKPFVCKICQREFAQKGHLRSHYRTHTGEKPYECEL